MSIFFRLFSESLPEPSLSSGDESEPEDIIAIQRTGKYREDVEELVHLPCRFEFSDLGAYLRPLDKIGEKRPDLSPLPGWPSSEKDSLRYIEKLDALSESSLLVGKPGKNAYISSLLQDVVLEYPNVNETLDVKGQKIHVLTHILSDILRFGRMVVLQPNGAKETLDNNNGSAFEVYRRCLALFQDDAAYTENLMKLANQAIFREMLEYLHIRVANPFLQYFLHVEKKWITVDRRREGITSITHEAVWGISNIDHTLRYFKTDICFNVADEELRETKSSSAFVTQKIGRMMKEPSEASAFDLRFGRFPSKAATAAEYYEKLIACTGEKEAIYPLFIRPLLESIHRIPKDAKDLFGNRMALRKLALLDEELCPPDLRSEELYDRCLAYYKDEKALHSALAFCMIGLYEYLFIYCRERFENAALDFLINCEDKELYISGNSEKRSICFITHWGINDGSKGEKAASVAIRATIKTSDKALIEGIKEEISLNLKII